MQTGQSITGSVTLQPGESKQFKIPEVERLTASSGACLEEALDTEEEHTLVITAKCGGVRTTSSRPAA